MLDGGKFYDEFRSWRLAASRRYLASNFLFIGYAIIKQYIIDIKDMLAEIHVLNSNNLTDFVFC